MRGTRAALRKNKVARGAGQNCARLAMSACPSLPVRLETGHVPFRLLAAVRMPGEPLDDEIWAPLAQLFAPAEEGPAEGDPRPWQMPLATDCIVVDVETWNRSLPGLRLSKLSEEPRRRGIQIGNG